MYAAVLTLHIFGAIATACAAAGAIAAIVRRNAAWQRRAARLLAALSVFEIATGIALSGISASVTAWSACGNFALYLSAVAAVQAALYASNSEQFPRRSAAASFAASLGMIGLALAFGA